MTTSHGAKLSLPLSNADADMVDQSSLRGAIVVFDSAGKRVILLQTQNRTVAVPFSDENIAYLKGLGIVAQWPLEEQSQLATPSEQTTTPHLGDIKGKLDQPRSAPAVSLAKDEPH